MLRSSLQSSVESSSLISEKLARTSWNCSPPTLARLLQQPHLPPQVQAQQLQAKRKRVTWHRCRIWLDGFKNRCQSSSLRWQDRFVAISILLSPFDIELACFRSNSVLQSIDPKSSNKMFTHCGTIISNDNRTCWRQRFSLPLFRPFVLLLTMQRHPGVDLAARGCLGRLTSLLTPLTS
jgi:hypothetical protein